MKPILVHAHIYYKDMWPELQACIKNIDPFAYELFVTIVEDNAEFIRDVLLFNPDANIQITENRGFDIGPFMHVTNQLDLTRYSYIVKLHTKRDIKNLNKEILNGFEMNGSKWRNYLLSFIRTPEAFKKHIEFLNENTNVGMLSSYRIIVDYDIYDRVANDMLNEFLKKRGLERIDYAFVAGTMFIVRASLFEKLKGMQIKILDFPESKRQGSQLAHMMERLFGYIVYLQGSTIMDCENDVDRRLIIKRLKIRLFLSRVLRFFYAAKISKSGKARVKVLKIPLPTNLARLCVRKFLSE